MDDSIPPELRERIAQLDIELAEIATAHPKSLEAEPTPELIYHYTDDNGLRGIIENGTLWCTDPYYLNDPSEIAYGVSIAADILAGTAIAISPAAEIFAHDFRRYQTDVQQVAHFFVCSFSTKGNDLEQWRARMRTTVEAVPSGLMAECLRRLSHRATVNPFKNI